MSNTFRFNAVIHKIILLLFISFLFFNAKIYAGTSVWQGPYLGAYIGGGFGNNHLSSDAGAVTSTSYFSTAADIAAVNRAGS